MPRPCVASLCPNPARTDREKVRGRKPGSSHEQSFSHENSSVAVAHTARHLSKTCDLDLPSAFLASELFFDNPTNALALGGLQRLAVSLLGVGAFL